MIIQEIHIDNFGIFNRYSLKNLTTGLNIIEGNNEAGKSTLLAFIRYTLFGYPDLRSNLNPYFPLSSDKRGGRIKALSSSKKKILFERLEGSKGGVINLTCQGKSSHDPIQWFELLGHATADLYHNIYSFSLDELISLDSLSRSGVEDKIFSVSLGLGNVSIGDIESNLENRMNQLHKQRSGKTEIAERLKIINEKKSHIRDIRELLPVYSRLHDEIKQVGKEITLRQEELSALKSELSLLKKYQTCYESYLVYCKTTETLQHLPDSQAYPPDGLTRLERLEEKKQEFKEKQYAIENGNRDEEGINELADRIKTITINSALLEQSEAIEYIRKNLEKYKQTRIDKDSDLEKFEQQNRSIKNRIDKISAQWREQNIIDFKEMILHRSEMEIFLTRFNELREKKHEFEIRQRVTADTTLPINTESVIIALSLIFMILVIPALLGSYYVWAGAFLVIAILLFIGRKHLFKKSAPANLKNQYEELKQQEKELKDLYETYVAEQLKLPVSLSPAAVLEILLEIDRIKQEIENRDEINEKQKNERIPFIGKFEKEIKSLLNFSKTENNGDPTEVLAARLLAEYDQSRAKALEKERLAETYGRRIRELDIIKNNLRSLGKEISDLLSAINASDSNDFRMKYAVNAQVAELLQSKQHAMQTMETVVGINSTEKIIDFYNAHGKEDIDAKLVDLDHVIGQKEEEIREYNLQMGEKRNETRRLESTSNLAESMTELGMHQVKLQNAYQEWLKGKIALRILSEVKNSYEKKRQPAVIKNSSAYFSAISGGKYQRVHVSLNNREITIFDSRESVKELGVLSRGTKEQLLISLRLGLIEEYEKQAESLPVIADETLVNFDPQRAKRTAEILLHFAEKRQVLLFTCHPVTKDYFPPSMVNLIRI